MGQFYFLKIEVDGHFHGGPAPKPWAAKITGIDTKFGLRREFVDKMNDWKDAKKAWSGNVYGVVATFPLRTGCLYEVSRCRGRSSKRYVSREFGVVEGGKLRSLEPIEALALVEGHDDPTVTLSLGDDPQAPPRVSEVTGLGTPAVKGWVVVDFQRLYRLRVGHLYEVLEGESRRLLLMEEGGAREVTEREALALLLERAA